MKRISFVKNRLLNSLIWMTLLYVVLPVGLYAMFQPSPDAPPKELPYILIIPYFLGILAHWYKNWQSGKMELNFLQYLTTNILGTIAGFVASLSSLVGLYATNPAALFPVGLGSWLTVFMFAIAGDTLNSGLTKFEKPPIE